MQISKILMRQGALSLGLLAFLFVGCNPVSRQEKEEALAKELSDYKASLSDEEIVQTQRELTYKQDWSKLPELIRAEISE